MLKLLPLLFTAASCALLIYADATLVNIALTIMVFCTFLILIIADAEEQARKYNRK